jgi:hypothetical protein
MDDDLCKNGKSAPGTKALFAPLWCKTRAEVARGQKEYTTVPMNMETHYERFAVTGNVLGHEAEYRVAFCE